MDLGLQHYSQVLFHEAPLVANYPFGIQTILEALGLQRGYGTVPQPTRLVSNEVLDRWIADGVGGDVRCLLKFETENSTGTFKDRCFIEPLLRIREILEGRIKSPLMCKFVSTGNHGAAGARGVAQMNETLRCDGRPEIVAEVTIDVGVPLHKRERLERLGARVRDRTPDGRPITSYRQAEDLVHLECERNPELYWQVPHADRFVVSGYAVIAHEILEQLLRSGHSFSSGHCDGDNVAILSPLGSGGLFSGLLYAKSLCPQIVSYGVAAAPADMSFRSLWDQTLIREEISTSATNPVDGNMATPEAYALKIIRNIADGVLLVHEEDAVFATALLKCAGVYPLEATSGLGLAAFLLYPELFRSVDTLVLPLTSPFVSGPVRDRIDNLATNPQALVEHFVQRRKELSGGASGIQFARTRVRGRY